MSAEAIFQDLVDEKDVYGYFGLGMVNQFVHKDYEAALKNYKVAANSSLPQAMHNIGYMYQHGVGLKADEVEAAKY
ncbi:hypothetical protein, partial [Janibacter hoylei]|uniref:hypothetical protein n=1 Tax=Janibacter hoylei TaxID=364298 RepID=UPI002493B641